MLRVQYDSSGFATEGTNRHDPERIEGIGLIFFILDLPFHHSCFIIKVESFFQSMGALYIFKWRWWISSRCIMKQLWNVSQTNQSHMYLPEWNDYSHFLKWPLLLKTYLWRNKNSTVLDKFSVVIWLWSSHFRENNQCKFIHSSHNGISFNDYSSIRWNHRDPFMLRF